MATVEAAIDGQRGRVCSTLDAEEQRADAMHRASCIIGWLESLPAMQCDVLVAAYRPPPSPWPARYALKLGRLAGVVAKLASVQGAYARACAKGRTEARSAVEWLDEQLARGDEREADSARAEAFGVYGRALAAYRAARGTRPSLAPVER